MCKGFLRLTLSGLCFALTAMSCLHRGNMEGTPPQKSDFFDFSMEQERLIDINYRFENNYVILFELYDRYPMVETEEGMVKKEIEPLYRAATNRKGEFVAKIKLPSAVTKLWLCTDYSGVVSPVELTVDNGVIAFDMAQYVEKYKNRSNTRAVTPNKHNYPDGWKILSDWDNKGRPLGLLPQTKLPSESTLYAINKVFFPAGNKPLYERYPKLFGSVMSSEVRIIKPTKINLAFIRSAASLNNSVGYFTYPTNNPPTSLGQIQHILAFPSSTLTEWHEGNGALLPGEQMELKYWDGTQFVDKFPAGISIGWFLLPQGFIAGDIKPVSYAPCRYSLSQFNSVDDKQRTVSLRDPYTDRIVAIAFEDKVDFKFNDAIFYLDVEEAGAIDPTMPELPDVGDTPTDENNATSQFGTLAFEDLWPNEGDYDMNDVMVDYQRKIYKRVENNKVYRIEDQFRPKHKGGSLQSGFGYQLTGIDPSLVTGVAVKGVETPSRFMEGQKMEPGQKYPTFVLFDKVYSHLDTTITVAIELADVDESLVLDAFNPFIVVEPEKSRGKEVHLVMYPPTDKADSGLFGTKNDASSPKYNIFYVSSLQNRQYPFALNIVGVKDFPVSTEARRIDESYPRFSSWVESGGLIDKDWYK